MSRLRYVLSALVVTGTFVGISAEAAPPTGWDSTIILRGKERAAVKSMPIEKRPMRPLHIYGNTIRRIEYRGQR
ncbi:MAG: hypothetical protein SFV81_00405 [Pirellulaceae bacterium]|jgi:hypothetical protein|nr:hypothetical protein [Pirellulaceae bacterium]